MEGNLLNCNSQPFEVVEMDVPAGVKGEEVVMFWVGGWGVVLHLPRQNINRF